MNMEKKLARALRTLASYTGGSDSPASHPCAKAWATLAEYEKARGPGREEKSAPALRACVSESTPDDYARTVDGAADLTARDWVARALETAREEDANNGGDAFGDIADDLRRALARMDRAKEASEEEDAQVRAALWIVEPATRSPSGRITGYRLRWTGARLGWLKDGFTRGWYRFKRDAVNAAKEGR